MAPEVLQSSAHDAQAADMWSCGVVLYTMLVGCYPFEPEGEQVVRLGAATTSLLRDNRRHAMSALSKQRCMHIMQIINLRSRALVQLLWFRLSFSQAQNMFLSQIFRAWC
jgi:serine/threonine protein kinase